MSVKKQKQKQNNGNVSFKEHLKEILPKTNNQQLAFDAFDEQLNLVLHGFAGTGKTFIATYLALDEIFQYDSKQQKIVFIRSVVPSRDIGYLPGTLEEKLSQYERPYQDICQELFNIKDAYDTLKLKMLVEFQSTSFLRGITIDNSIIIVDEYQNMCDNELNTILSRVGDSSRIILCGDYHQRDLKDKESAILKYNQIMEQMNQFRFIEFTENDIVRSKFVKSFIIEKANWEFNKSQKI